MVFRFSAFFDSASLVIAYLHRGGYRFSDFFTYKTHNSLQLASVRPHTRNEKERICTAMAPDKQIIVGGASDWNSAIDLILKKILLCFF